MTHLLHQTSLKFDSAGKSGYTAQEEGASFTSES